MTPEDVDKTLTSILAEQDQTLSAVRDQLQGMNSLEIALMVAKILETISESLAEMCGSYAILKAAGSVSRESEELFSGLTSLLMRGATQLLKDSESSMKSAE